MNMENDKVIIIGAFHETVELCELCNKQIIGIIDSCRTDSFMGYPILGSDEDAYSIYSSYPDCGIIISPDSSKVKRKLSQLYSNAGFRFASLISPKATISRTAKIGNGVIIQSGVNVSSSAEVGDFCKLNFNSNIMHDVVIGNYSIIAPNAVLLGRAKIGSDTYIGANSTILTDTYVPDTTNVKPCSIL